MYSWNGPARPKSGTIFSLWRGPEFEEVTETYHDQPLNCVGSKARGLQKVVSLQVPAPCDLAAFQRVDEQAL